MNALIAILVLGYLVWLVICARGDQLADASSVYGPQPRKPKKCVEPTWFECTGSIEFIMFATPAGVVAWHRDRETGEMIPMQVVMKGGDSIEAE